MAVAETRLLVLGAVTIFEPVNGYQIRRELLSWNVEDWAHIKPGSIYSALSTLTSRGYAQRHDVVDGTREVAVYTSTADGRRELQHMLGEALETVDLVVPLAFQTALGLLPLLERSQVLDHLEKRRELLIEEKNQSATRADEAADGPPHVSMMVEFWDRLGQTELEWVDEFISRIKDGEFAFAGEPAGWTLRDDDPGWQIEADRQRYRRLLGLESS